MLQNSYTQNKSQLTSKIVISHEHWPPIKNDSTFT